MPKLSGDDKFIDFSDYGRPIASFLARHLSRVKVNAIQVTVLFLLAGLACACCIYTGHLVWAAFFIMLKNILDGADGEIARITRHPSMVGRYLDSVFDFIINLIILLTLFYSVNSTKTIFVLAFLGIEFQCSVYNYYYVILRRKRNDQETSRIIEYRRPVAYPYESQRAANVLHAAFLCLYLVFDSIVLLLDQQARFVEYFPKWFMSMLSLLGLGFQLLIIGVLLCAGRPELILPFFAWYSVFGLVIIIIRKLLVR